jgi:hypothetical protein
MQRASVLSTAAGDAPKGRYVTTGLVTLDAAAAFGRPIGAPALVARHRTPYGKTRRQFLRLD